MEALRRHCIALVVVAGCSRSTVEEVEHSRTLESAPEGMAPDVLAPLPEELLNVGRLTLQFLPKASSRRSSEGRELADVRFFVRNHEGEFLQLGVIETDLEETWGGFYAEGCRVADFNADGHVDFAAPTAPSHPTGFSYAFFIFDPDRQAFRPSPLLTDEGRGAVSWHYEDPTKRVRFTHKGSCCTLSETEVAATPTGLAVVARVSKDFVTSSCTRSTRREDGAWVSHPIACEE